ncbi:transposase [Candidatus Desantisbacteria bacterium]|nr:transposase [Candidatus Desantisbacteria bacterium]
MPRKTRSYQLEQSLVYHVINRGIIRQTIFHDEDDMKQFISLIKRYQGKFDFNIYHWCLMNNHYHLLMKLANSKDLSKIIGAIQQIYAGYHHKRYQTAGRLFQSRFKSQTIEKSDYLLACGRYIERNPVRANLVQTPWEWEWSSARYYALCQKDGITEDDTEWIDMRWSKEEYQNWLLEGEKAREDEKFFCSNRSLIVNNELSKQLMKVNGRTYLFKRGRTRK